MNNLKVVTKTIDIFSNILGTRLWFSNDDVPSSDGHHIMAPLRDPLHYTMVEGHLAHLLFKSDPLAKFYFIEGYEKELLGHAKRLNIEINPIYIGRFLETVVDILNTHRVYHLWSKIYPGSELRLLRIRENYARTALSLVNPLVFNPTAILACASANLSITAFTAFFAECIYLIDSIKESSYEHVLLATKEFVRKCIEYALETNDISLFSKQTRLDTLNDIAKDSFKKPRTDNLLSKYRKDEEPAALKGTLLLAVPLSEIHNVREVGEEETLKLLKEVEEKISRPDKKDINIETGIRAIFRNPRGFNINSYSDLIETRSYLTEQLTVTESQPKQKKLREDLNCIDFILKNWDQDDLTIRKLRSLFSRVIGKRSHILDDCGVEPDIQTWIQTKCTQQSTPIFKKESLKAGFRALILVDRSLSMKGTRILQSERACRILSRSMDFPFVELDIWGFQSLADGQIDIIRHPKRSKYFGSGFTDLGGGTPLHAAISLASREIEAGASTKHVFVITDGFPEFSDRDGNEVSIGTLLKAVRKAVIDSKSRGVQTTGLLIGSKNGYGRISQAVSDKQMDMMFGAQWKLLDPDRLDTGVVQVISSTFIRNITRN